jgi:hypothetical protein
MPDLTSSSLKQKRELFQRLTVDRVDNDNIAPCQRPEKLPVSFIQEQVIGAELAGLYDPEKTRVNCPALSYLIKGAINISALDKALCEIVRRHEILRTNYIVIDKQIFQNINNSPDTILHVSDLRNLPQNDRKNEAARILTELTACPFSFFDNKLMISATLIITGENEYILTIITNHIATDGLSMMILQQELFTLYQAFFFNTPSPLPELPIQYIDFTMWERKHYTGEFLENRLDYWRKIPDTINTFLPVDHKPASSSYTGDTVPVSILPELVKRLSLLGRNNKVTLFTVLFSAFISLIHVFSGYKCNFFCMPVANRLRKETHSIIGCLMNFQFVHIDLDGNPTFTELVERVNKTLLDVYANYVPFHFITGVIPQQGPVADFQLQTSMDLMAPNAGEQSPRDESQQEAAPRSKLFPQSTAGSLAILPFNLPQPAFALFPIDVFLSGNSDGVSGHFKYQTAAYDRSTILKLANDYVVLLTKLVRNPDMRIHEMGIKPHPGADAI